MEPASVIGASSASNFLPVTGITISSCEAPGPVTSGASASPSGPEVRLAHLIATISSLAWPPEIECEGVA
eukprot:10886771-Lingulodinium_polyedra.AAC.1